ncbi:MAG: hypothetical protein ACI4O7_12485 [Aristaeellaceae bacterium]
MRKIMTAGLCLVTVLCLCAGALAADQTLLVREAEDDELYFYPQQLLTVGDTLYILCSMEDSCSLYRWQEGMAEAELLTEGLFRANRFDTMAEALEYVENAKEPVPGDPEHALGNLVFTDGERLMALNPLNGQLFAFSVENGEIVYEDLAKAEDVSLLRHASEEYSYWLYPESWAVADGRLLLPLMDWNDATGEADRRMIVMDLATGVMTRADLPYSETVTGCRDGQIMLLVRDPDNPYDSEKGEYYPYDLVLWNPADNTTQTVGQLQEEWVNRISYLPAEDALIYMNDTRIMGVTGLTGKEQYGYAPATYGQSSTVVGDSLAFISNSRVYLRTLTRGFDTDDCVTVYGSYMSDGAEAFAEKYPQTPVYFYRDYYGTAEELSQAMLTGDDAMDVLRMSNDEIALSTLMDKGYCADLSGDAELMAYVSSLYPAFRDAVMRDGKLCAIPISAYSYDGWFVNLTVMEDMGLTEEDLPTNMVELCAFANRWNDEWVEEYPSYTLVSYVEDYKEMMFYWMFSGYLSYCQAENMELRFDTPVFRELMTALESLDVEELNRGANLANEDEEGYRAGLFMEGYGVVGSFYDPEKENRASILKPITLTADTAWHPEVHMEVLFVNPRSAHMDAAVKLIKEEIAHLNDTYAHVLRMDATDPVRYDYYDQWVQSAQKALDDARKALEEADEADRKDYQLQVEELERNLEDVKANEYMISEGGIRYYQETVAPAMYVSRPSVFYTSEDASGELSTLLERYMQGQIGLEQLIREMDSKIMMMQMENY